MFGVGEGSVELPISEQEGNWGLPDTFYVNVQIEVPFKHFDFQESPKLSNHRDHNTMSAAQPGKQPDCPHWPNWMHSSGVLRNEVLRDLPCEKKGS